MTKEILAKKIQVDKNSQVEVGRWQVIVSRWQSSRSSSSILNILCTDDVVLGLTESMTFHVHVRRFLNPV